MNSLTVKSPLLLPLDRDRALTPAMVLALWVIADALDNKKLTKTPLDGVWLSIPAASLRGSEARNDNTWLKTCLDRMTGLKLGGEYRGNPWGAVVLSQWEIIEGGSVVRVLLPPAAIEALRAPETFAQIETHAAYKLQGPARLLYGILADKKRMGNPYWVFDLEELRHLLGVEGKKSYKRFNNFRFRVLDPAVEQINDFGTVKLTMTPQRIGRAISSVRFDWRWKDVGEVRETVEENERHPLARRKEAPTSPDCPPLSDEGRRQEADRRWKEAVRQAKENGAPPQNWPQRHDFG